MTLIRLDHMFMLFLLLLLLLLLLLFFKVRRLITPYHYIKQEISVRSISSVLYTATPPYSMVSQKRAESGS